MKTVNKKQGGFTLIELMIVVTIIGILASIAVPAYRDYTIRTRVGECASVFSPMKTEVSIYYSENGQLPADLTALASPGRISDTPTEYSGDYVEELDYTSPVATCTLQDIATLGPAVADGGAAGGELTFSAVVTGNTINWTTGTTNDLPEKYWP